MIVNKFGGASIKDADSIKRLPELIKISEDDRMFVVISALGKTTNQLENIVNKSVAHQLCVDNFNELKKNHFNIVDILFNSPDSVVDKLNSLFDECWNKIVLLDHSNYDYYYDQIVSFGELFSSLIVSEYLKIKEFDVVLKNAGALFVSDDNWRSGNIDLDLSKRRVSQMVNYIHAKIIVTQGFIASTKSGDMITLGREGSDYSAALLASFIGAKELNFWKDVDGIYSADPKIFCDAIKLEKISYDEMVELSYFGAKILHKKTLSVLKDRNVITRVRSFIYPQNEGTSLYNEIDCNYPPIKICLENQILITVETLSGHIVKGDDVKLVYDLATACKFDINLIQISAIKISFCVSYNKYTCERLLDSLKNNFKVKYNTEVTLETVRHCTDKEITALVNSSKVLLTQISRSVVQVVITQ